LRISANAAAVFKIAVRAVSWRTKMGVPAWYIDKVMVLEILGGSMSFCYAPHSTLTA
jgi:hypothetical protein